MSQLAQGIESRRSAKAKANDVNFLLHHVKETIHAMP